MLCDAVRLVSLSGLQAAAFATSQELAKGCCSLAALLPSNCKLSIPVQCHEGHTSVICPVFL